MTPVAGRRQCADASFTTVATAGEATGQLWHNLVLLPKSRGGVSRMTNPDTQAMLDRFAAAPDALRRAIADLDPRSYDRSPSTGEWTPRQIVRHLADTETLGALCIRLTIAQQQPTLPLYDQEAWARNLDYAHDDPATLAGAIELFSLLRAASTRLLAMLPPDGWVRAADHPRRGRTTVRDLLEMYTTHAQSHLDQLRKGAAQ